MGIILLALIASGTSVPLCVIVSCALAMAFGTYTGGWRVIRTLGKGLVELEPRQRMATVPAAAAVGARSSASQRHRRVSARSAPASAQESCTVA
jgi:PiT family inorganic phosphate transporter